MSQERVSNRVSLPKESQYAFPFITWEQYRELIESDNRFKMANPDEWERRRKDNEHRMLYGCKVCGFQGIQGRRKP